MTIILQPIGTTPVDGFVREVMMWLPQAPVFEVEYRLKQTLKDFCRRTHHWRQRDTALLTTVAGQAEYAAGLPPGVDLHAIVSAWDGDTPLPIGQPDDDEAIAPGERSMTPTVVAGDDNVIRLTPAPLVSGRTYIGTVCFAPNEASEEVPSTIFYRWRDAIRVGCLARMMLQVGKTWSNPGQARLHGEEYDAYCTEASNAAGAVPGARLRVREA